MSDSEGSELPAEGGEMSHPAEENAGTLLDHELSLDRLLDHLNVSDADREEADTDEDLLEAVTTPELAGAVWRCIKASEHEFRKLEDTGELWYYDTDAGLWKPDGMARIKQLANWMLTDATCTRSLLRELESKVETEPLEKELEIIDRDTLGAQPGQLLLKNGALDLTTRELREPAPEDYFIRQLPVEYDATTSIEGTRFEQFIAEAPAPEDRDRLQEYGGYTLWAGAQPFKKALFLIGPTDAGKGTFLKTIECILGSENVAWQSLYDLIGTRWGTSKIYDTLANMSNEVTGGSLSRVERFKELTGGEDTVTAEFKGQPTFEFTVTQKFLFATNQFPRMQNADEAFFNRCLFAEFPETVPADEHEDLMGQFEREREAIFNWMLDGLDRLREQGHFSAERPIDAKRGVARSFGSPVAQFVYDALEVTGRPGDVIRKDELYDAFTRYCDFIEADKTPGKGTLTTELKREPGVKDSNSRRLVRPDDDTDRPPAYSGLLPDEDAFQRFQAPVPKYASDPDKSDGDGDRYGEDAGGGDRQAGLDEVR